MEAGVVVGRGHAQSFGCAAGRRGPGRRAGPRWVRAGQAGQRPGDYSLFGFEEESRVVRLFGVWRSWRGPPVLPGAAVLMRRRRRLTPGWILVVMGWMFGLHGPAPLFLVPACLVSRLLRCIALIPEALVLMGVTSVHPGTTSGAGVSRLTQGSPRTRLTLVRPARIVPASGSGGVMVRAVAPVIPGSSARVLGPAFEPRRSEQRRGGVAFGQSGAHRSLTRDRRSDGAPGGWMEVERRKRGQPHLHVQPGGTRALLPRRRQLD